MAAVARAGPHRRVKDDEVVAHYARAGDGSLGVIRLGQLAERVVVALPRLRILRIKNDRAASDEDSKEPQRRGRTGECRHSTKRALSLSAISASEVLFGHRPTRWLHG